MKSICVYLGAASGHSEWLRHSAMQLGKEIALRGWRLVYGGSSLGLMGALAQSTLDNGGMVTGIIPTMLIAKEKPPANLSQLLVAENMQQRKLLLQEHADAFVVMPGGFGTLEETFETWNAIKLGVINKPLGFLNLQGFYDSLFDFITHCQQQGFVSSAQRDIPLVATCPQLLLDYLFNQELSYSA